MEEAAEPGNYLDEHMLSTDDIQRYQRIVIALHETIRIMGEIDELIEAHGGWPMWSVV